MKICKVDLCNGKVIAKEYCDKHYRRILHNNSLEPKVEMHGMRHTREYNIWGAMKTRCYNSNTRAYENYGGRGIKICDRWLESFSNFYEDMGSSPEGYSIDRINNDGNYEPLNCRWTDATTQSINQRLRKDNKSGHRGVYSYVTKDNSIRWRCYSQRHKTLTHIGTFPTVLEAVKARNSFLKSKNISEKTRQT